MKTKRKQLPNDRYIHKAWLNIKDPGGLSSLTEFAKSRKNAYDLRSLEKSLAKLEVFSRYKRQRKKYKRPAVIVNRPFYNYCTDLLQITDLAWHNNGYGWVLVLKDMFTKYCVLVPMKRKTADQTAEALEKGFRDMKKGGKNWKEQNKLIQHDGGNEYFNAKVKAVLAKINCHQYQSKTPQKASQCEALIKRVKGFLYRYMEANGTKKWITILQDVAKRINNSVHSSHHFKPVDVNEKNSGEAFSNMFLSVAMTPRKPPKFKVGDNVRISSNRLITNPFAKHYKPQFSKEIFTVKLVKPTYPVYSYVVETSDQKEVDTSFTEEELSLAVIEE